jgi:dipeptidyl aminopeptidase/acylaminoacyl peptidase
MNATEDRDKSLEIEGQAILERCQRVADRFYDLADGEELNEITSLILESDETDSSVKQIVKETGRRIFLFKYPSDGFQVKGFLSFIPNHSRDPLLLFLRGGNLIFGLPHPATNLTCMKNYTVLATVYRGGVSEGSDEYGGREVNDVANLVDYFPILQQKLGLSFEPEKVFMLGRSRGGMEMFLALARSRKLQSLVQKAVSLSGLLDFNECLRDRNDMQTLFEEKFGLEPHKNKEAWIAARNPVEKVDQIRKDLPFLILQGTDDLRVSLTEGLNMVKKLEENGMPVTYREILGGDHCLNNYPELPNLISEWLEK